MKKLLFGIIIIAVIVFFALKKHNYNTSNIIIKEHSALIQEQIKNVGKLIVTEGHFSQIFNYNNSKAIFSDFFSADKKALVIVNADVHISYDLSKITYDIDEKNKVLKITRIPKEEININPNIEYYDLKQDFFNPFKAEDYNKIKEIVNKSLRKKIEASDFKKNAKNRLLSELSKFYILTSSLGWTLQYNEQTIENLEDLKL